MSSLTDEALVAALSDSPWERLQAAQLTQPVDRLVGPFAPPPWWRCMLDRAIARLELLVFLLEADMRPLGDGLAPSRMALVDERPSW